MNRRKLTMINSMVVLFTTMVNAIMGLVEVKLFISIYGSSVNGLMQTGNQLMSYIALLEAGISASYIYHLYGPIAREDQEAVSSLYCGFKKSINKTVLQMLVGAMVVSAVYPLFLSQEGFSYWFMASVFALLSIKTIAPYFFTYVPKYMIIAKEQKYKSDLINCLTRVLTYTVEIFLMLFSSVPIHVLLICCVIVSMLSGALYNIEMRRVYADRIERHAKPDCAPSKMTKDVLPHNISTLIFYSTDNIILSIFCSLNTVTLYSNYNLILSQVNTVFQGIFDGITASLGTKIVCKDRNAYSSYRELLSLSLFCGSLIFTVFVIMINDFISLWVGEPFCLDTLDVYLFGMILYCGVILPCINAARNARGLYKESKKFVILQTVMNLVITVILTPFLGITGALLGTFLARFCITVPCNYILVNQMVFPEYKPDQLELPANIIVMVVVSFVLNYGYRGIIQNVLGGNTVWLFVVRTVIVTFVCLVMFGIFFYAYSPYFKGFLTHYIRYKGNKNG